LALIANSTHLQLFADDTHPERKNENFTDLQFQ